jgi:ketosteroid isomerase-like protein
MNKQNHKILQMENQIKEIFSNVCQALNASDIDLALSYFSDSKNMIKVSNGHVLRGKKELSEYWHKNISTSKIIRISIDNVEINKIDEKRVWTIAEEYISLGENNYKAIVTNIFVSTDSGWKILLDHTTPIMQDEVSD